MEQITGKYYDGNVLSNKTSKTNLKQNDEWEVSG